MVGLFWITADAVHVGAPPGIAGQGARLTEKGVEHPDGDRLWTWEDLDSASVEAAPVRSTLRRRLALAAEFVLTAGLGGAGEPPAMLLCLETPSSREELPVQAATSAYDEEEFTRSQSLLTLFVTGTASPRTLMTWAQSADGTTPKSPERRALLREWTGA